MAGYGWKVELDGRDITDLVSGFEVTSRIDQYCLELRIDLADTSLFSLADFAQLPDSPRIEVFTRTDANAPWASQGRFFIERPTFEHQVSEGRISGVWGRSETARLGSPFAATVTKRWEDRTTLYAVAEEMCSLAGLTWDVNAQRAPDVEIYGNTFEVEHLYPVDVLSRLAELCGYILGADRAGRVYYDRLNYSPDAPDITVADAAMGSISQSVTWPQFGNRVRITTAAMGMSGGVDFLEDKICLLGDGTDSADVHVRVTDPDGLPVNYGVVEWQVKDPDLVYLDETTTNTGPYVVADEEAKAVSYYDVTVKWPPSEVVSAVAKTAPELGDLARYGYTIDGNTITFARQLPYCDTTMIVTYRVDGVATNTVHDYPGHGTTHVVASVDSAKDELPVHVGNPCACPEDSEDGDEEHDSGITLEANPNPICCKMSEICTCGAPMGCTSRLLVTVHEMGYVPEDGVVEFTEDSNGTKGKLQYDSVRLGTIRADYVDATVAEDTGQFYRCRTKYFFLGLPQARLYSDAYHYIPLPVVKVEGLDVFLAKSVALQMGTKIYLFGVIKGAGINYLDGIAPGGTVTVTATYQGAREEPYSASVEVKVACGNSPSPGPPPDDGGPEPWVPPDDGGGGGGDGDGPKPDPEAWCPVGDGKYIPCDDWCCEKDGVPGCYQYDECDAPDDPLDPCATINDDAYRFSQGLAEGCTCDEMCRWELDNLGTTRSYDNYSGRTIDEIVQEDYGLEAGSPEYWEKRAELEEDALNQCLRDCGSCEVAHDPITVEGPNAVSEGAYGYAADGGVPPYQWAVHPAEDQGGETIGGGDVSISADGRLTVGDDACGSWVVEATDSCGEQGRLLVRMVENGQWSALYYWRRPVYSAGTGCNGDCGDPGNPGDYCYLPSQIYEPYSDPAVDCDNLHDVRVQRDQAQVVVYCGADYRDQCMANLRANYSEWMEANTPFIELEAIRCADGGPWIKQLGGEDHEMIIGVKYRVWRC